MNNKELKTNAVGAFIGRPHFGENTLESPTAYTNSKSKIKTLTSDHKGITLIALVITIIVMLILVAVTVTIALNGGLFSTAKQAKADTQANIDAEQRLASGRIKVDGKWYDSLEDYTKGIESSDQNDEPSKWAQDSNGNITYEGEQSGIKIGDYVNYKPDEGIYSKDKLTKDYTGNTDSDYNNLDLETENLKWRVLGVDTKGCLTLISDDPTAGRVYFEGATGYNNGVYILNDICEKLYSNTKLGIKARSITIEDIEAGLNKEGIDERNEYISYGDVKYGETKTYTSNLNYPVIYAGENGSGIDVTEANAGTGIKTNGIGGSDPFYKTENELTNKTDNKESDTANTSLTCTQTYYCFEDTPQTYCKNEKFYEMIFKTNTYYCLATRFVGCFSDYVRFGLRSVRNENLHIDDLFVSTTESNNEDYYLRPVVSLGSNISIKTVDNNSEDSPHQINELK